MIYKALKQLDEKMSELILSEKHYKIREKLKSFLSKELEPIKNQINKNNKVPISLFKKIGKMTSKVYNQKSTEMIQHNNISNR